MHILSIENMSKQYGERTLFEDVTFGIGDTDRLGLIGVNGTGKTTFLKVIAGLEPPDEGRISRAGGAAGPAKNSCGCGSKVMTKRGKPSWEDGSASWFRIA